MTLKLHLSITPLLALSTFLGFVMPVCGAEPLLVTGLRVEQRTNPSAVDKKAPRFSWRFESELRGVRQVAFQIQVADSASALASGDALLWDTGRVDSDQSHLVAYGGPSLESGARRFWQVKAWDNQGRESTWSEPAHWDVGVLDSADWKAKWIEPNDPAFIESRVAPIFRTEFKLAKPVKRATAFVTAHGVYVAELNGQRVGDVELAPGWTSYHQRLEYQQYDVTEMLRDGANAIGATVGQGWWRGHLHSAAKPDSARIASALDYPDFYGDAPALFLQLEIEYADGTRETITTGEDWQWSSGETVMDDLYAGETIDMRKRQHGWSEPGFDESDWNPVRVADFGAETLTGQTRQPTRKLRERKPQRIFEDANGDTIVDFGEHIAGWERIVLSGKPGDSVTIEHASVINSEGKFDTYTNRRATQITTCILSAEGDEVFEPRFLYYGFRYLRIKGYEGELKPEDITAWQIAADMPQIGEFACSDPLLSRFYEMMVRTLRGNTVAVPTDNPERNERLGWMFASILDSACWSLDGSTFYPSWLTDLAADQGADGFTPSIAPYMTPMTYNAATPARSDYIITGPWRLYRQYGDREMLESFYPFMRRWIDYLKARSTGYLREPGGRWGDWLAMRHDGEPQGSDAHLLAQCFFVHGLDLMAEIAAELGHDADANGYAKDAQRARDAFAAHFMEPDGRIRTPSQTQVSYMLPLALDAVAESRKPEVLEQWMERLEEAGGVAEVGCLSMPWFFPALERFGKTEEVYRALMHEQIPSWRYMAAHEPSTTIWERWNGIRENGKYFHEPDENGKRPPGNMSAWNQPQLGDIGGTLFGVVGGIQPAEPGFKRIRIAPAIPRTEQPEWARVSHDTPYGRVVSSWTREGKKLTLDVTLPPNTTATVSLPAPSPDAVAESGAPLAEAGGVMSTRTMNGHVVCEVQSGHYRFTTDLTFLEP